MPSRKGTRGGGDMRERAARNGKKVGRPPEGVTIRISIEAGAALQARMLRNEGAATPEALIELLIYQGVLVDPALA